jgi:excisionase family DNA binding protein
MRHMESIEGTPRLAYRVPEIRELLGIGRDKAYSLVNSGKIHSIRDGNTILVPKSALDRFLAGDNG